MCLTIRKCSKRKVVQKAVYHSIVSSNFAANMVYSSGRVAEKLLIHQKQPSTHSITTISFFKSLGEMACITGVVSLSLIQFLKLRKLNINNKIINFFDTAVIVQENLPGPLLYGHSVVQSQLVHYATITLLNL